MTFSVSMVVHYWLTKYLVEDHNMGIFGAAMSLNLAYFANLFLVWFVRVFSSYTTTLYNQLVNNNTLRENAGCSPPNVR